MKVLITEKQSQLLSLNESKGSQTRTYLIDDPSDPTRSFQVKGPYELIYGQPIELPVGKVYKANQQVEIVYYVINSSETPLQITSLQNQYTGVNSIVGAYRQPYTFKTEYTKDSIPKNYQGLISISFKIGPNAKGNLAPVNNTNIVKFKYGSKPPSLTPNNKNEWNIAGTYTPKNPNNPEINKTFYFAFYAPGDLTFFEGNTNEQKHMINTVWSIGALFIPYIGPYISIGFQLYDAKLYKDEGKKQEAGLCLMFAMLPGVGKILPKIPLIKKWSSLALAKIAQKIGMRQTLSAAESEVVEAIAKNKEFVESSTLEAMSNQQLVSAASREVAMLPGVSKGFADGMSKFSATFAAYGTASYTYNKAYVYINGDDPQVIARKLGMDWEMMRKIFGSDNSKEDNLKLVAAIKDGWRPGMVVPVKHRTKTWSRLYGDEIY